MDTKELLVVQVETRADFAPWVEIGLEILGIEAVLWEQKDGVRFDVFMTDRGNAEACLAELREHLREWADGEPWKAGIRTLPAQGWQERWKEHFHAARVSPRLVVKPSWETWNAKPDDRIIEIDPGMCFGTGLHPTTRTCLKFLDKVSREHPGTTCLDVGCGSGILSIAAAKLGFVKTVAVDCDPLAVRTTEENVARNGVDALVECRQADLKSWSLTERFDVVAANLFANVLVEGASRLAGCSSRKPGGRVILSGIRSDQYDSVKRAYRKVGLQEADSETDEGWTTGCFQFQSDVETLTEGIRT